MAVEGHFLVEFISQDYHMGLVVELLEELLGSLEGKETDVSVSVFQQSPTGKSVIYPILLVEDYSLFLIIYSPLQTNHKPFMQSFMQQRPIFDEDRPEFNDSLVNFCGGEMLEDSRAHERPSFQIVEDQIIDRGAHGQLYISSADDRADGLLDGRSTALSSLVVSQGSLSEDLPLM